MTAIEKFTHFYQQLKDRDISGITDVYDTNIEFIDPIATHQGIEVVQRYFDKLLKGTRWCDFDIRKVRSSSDTEHTVEWVMRFESKKLKRAEPIVVDGITVLKTNADKVIYHRDYYDMGQLVYENIPILSFFVKRVKGQLQ
ncbi:DUF2358 domain-containing protein [Alteromonas sp. ASW11-36]|uniref:DUF2358 domain-containing protein n=1 Tax=Alteromonas arenosi TaxID=3055817 RepID=A0ABT7SUC9_9ALTE|nr:nuclear transport factor 2 family protein [Alteromonas sp. ASW11-36]MDM7859791.1 DUF2358 domain-containing protein [Alteromonas sp. ASW11-36]